MADPNEAGKNARAVFLVDSSGNPIGSSAAPIVADTELPAAAALADDTATPTVPAVGAYGMGFDGTTWDRLRTKGTGWQGVAPVRSSDGAELFLLSTDGDAVGAGTKLVELVQACRFNGVSWDRHRNTVEATLLASAARTTTQASADIVTYNARTLIVVLDMTNVAASPSVTVLIEGKDAASGKYYTLLQGSAITTTSTNRYRVGPTLAAAANSVAQDYLPRIIRITVTANNANSGTYSVGYVLGN